MNKRLSYILRNLAFLLLGLLILYLVFQGTDTSKVIQQLKQVNYWWLFIPKVFSIGAHILRAARWNLVLNSLGYSPGLFNSTLSVMTGYLTNLGLPKVGDIFRCWALKRTDGVPVNASIGSVVVERAIDTLTLFILLFFVFVFHYDLVGNFIIENIFEALAIKIKASVIGKELYFYMLGGLFLIILLLFYLFRKAFQKTFVYQKFVRFLQSIWEGIIALKNMNNKWGFLAYTLFIWIFYFIHFQLLFYCLAETSGIDTLDGFFIFTIRGFGMAAPIQAGIGAYHWMVTEGMQVLGISNNIALAFAIATHAAGVVFKIVMGAFSLVMIMGITGKFLLKETPTKEKTS